VTLLASSKHMLPAALPGYEHINRYWDRAMDVPAAKILPGEFYVSLRGEMIVTVLGSCVSACVRDKNLGIGGMNHFMLPVKGDHSRTWGSNPISAETRYGNWAMEYLINEILKNGGLRKNLEVKLFGGGKVLANMGDVGLRNIEFVKQYLKDEGLSIVAEDLGDYFPRKVLYFPDTGAVKVKKLRNMHNDTILRRELAYSSEITKPDLEEGDIELFD
jgi:chemotaxis protein CheD